jgi:PAS domain S-box-containing protein
VCKCSGWWQTEAMNRSVSSAELHHVLYRMAERATAGLSFYDFLRSVHALLGELLYAKNFYVCLSNVARQTLDFPYYVDERDGDTMQCNDVPMRRGLTEFVLRTGEPQLIDAGRFPALVASGDVTEATGDLTFSAWLGVPLPLHGGVGGVLAVQSYEPGVGYLASDIQVLSFVANQFGSVIERHQAIEALRSSESRYRAVFEHLGVGVAVVQDGVTQFLNPAMAQLLGWARGDLLHQPFTKALHPDDVAPVVARHQRRLRGEVVEGYAVVRFLTAAGQTRHLEVSGAVLDWSGQPATLLFAVDVTARLEAEQAQRQTLAHQQELNALRTRFIAMASHEFRTPLTSIGGAVDLLDTYGDRLDAAERREALERIRRAVARMTRMVEGVLRIGAEDAALLAFEPKATPVAELCRAVVAEAQAEPRGHSCPISLRCPPEGETHGLDENLVRHILTNLLSNAIKYSPSGSEVRCVVWADGAWLKFRVEDDGMGIAPQDKPRLFDSFHRGSNVGAIPGTGLGLSIVKQAVDRHQGLIEVESELGKGTCVTVSLPLRVGPP